MLRYGVLTASLISIHALLAESDQPYQFGHPYTKNFYPRSPCGERLLLWRRQKLKTSISIHALLAESDYGKEVQ